MRRGLTMIELLLALSLLGVIALAVASWTHVAAGAAAGVSQPRRWLAAAEAVLQLIHDDVAGSAGGSAGQLREPPVRAADGALEIRTRSTAPGGLAGPMTSRYSHEPASGRLVLQQRTPDGRQSTRLLLDRVEQWEVGIDKEKRRLDVRITSQDVQAARSFDVP